VSTHSLEQALTASRCAAVDYIGFGPIFATTSKQNPDPVRGVEGLRMVRANVDRPIVAIGGITTASAPEVLAAGADAVAMIGEVVGAADIEATVRRLLRL
jgi:thiamine-phosphate pyrophosphorylase